MSAVNLRNAALILKSGDLVANTTNQYGTCDTNLTNFTWYNINLRTVLGDMYDKYDLFNLCLISVSIADPTLLAHLPGNTEDDKIVQMCITGLPFINQTYSAVDCSNTNVAVLGIADMAAAGTSIYGYFGHCLTFSKQQDVVNLNIFYQRIHPYVTQVLPITATYNVQTAYPYQDVLFNFKIFGIDKTENNNGTRIF